MCSYITLYPIYYTYYNKINNSLKPNSDQIVQLTHLRAKEMVKGKEQLH